MKYDSLEYVQSAISGFISDSISDYYECKDKIITHDEYCAKRQKRFIEMPKQFEGICKSEGLNSGVGRLCRITKNLIDYEIEKIETKKIPRLLGMVLMFVAFIGLGALLCSFMNSYISALITIGLGGISYYTYIYRDRKLNELQKKRSEAMRSFETDFLKAEIEYKH
ncbi:MAG: hypothetical protein RR612_09285 [Oscillospiraceae bacterium]